MDGICVVGAGQIGSRHLQSLAASGRGWDLHAVEPRTDSLALTRDRLGAFAERVRFHPTTDSLPGALDVVIVATAADVRREVVTRLLAAHEVRHLILEKVLFQSPADCLWAREFLRPSSVWVNFPRRLQPAYRLIRQELAGGGAFAVHVTGSRWGLASNAVHFLDLVEYLTGVSGLTVDRFDADAFPSQRRVGFLECAGVMVGMAGARRAWSIASWNDGTAPVRVTVEGLDQRWVVDELEDRAIVNRSSVKSSWKAAAETMRLHYQSELTASVIDDLLAKDVCGLADYETALASHLPFLRAWNRRFAPDADADLAPCPIT